MDILGIAVLIFLVTDPDATGWRQRARDPALSRDPRKDRRGTRRGRAAWSLARAEPGGTRGPMVK